MLELLYTKYTNCLEVSGGKMSSSPQTYTVSDFIEWHKKKQLVLDPDFQRGSVWTPNAKVFLIDTILNDYPIPQVYFRTKIDPSTQTIIREVVDGQQRLRAILDFAADKMRLTGKAPKHKGKSYSSLSDDDKQAFLSYKIPAVQLINASNAAVLEVFARLNSYSVKVTPAELRHAEFSEPVKWAIYDTTRKWSTLWNDYSVVPVRESVRLRNTSVVADMFMAVDQGWGDAGEPNITKYYKSRIEKDEEYFVSIREIFDSIVGEIIDNLAKDFSRTTFFDAPNFVALFCAIGILYAKIPAGKATEKSNQFNGKGVDWDKAKTGLANLAQAVEDDDTEGGPHSAFVAATKSTTHRISSRAVRLDNIIRAIAKDDV
jgi:hypothetical protein